MNLNNEDLYNTSIDFFLPLQGEEKYRTEGFKEIFLIYGTTEESYRKAAELINRIRHQEEGGTPSRTMRDNTENEGRKIQKHIEEKTKKILQENDFTQEGQTGKVIIGSFSPKPILEEARIYEIVKNCEIEESIKSAILKNSVPYEDGKEAVNISLDDVGVKKQKEKRKKKMQETASEKKRKYVQNTVIHVEKEGRSYILNGSGVHRVLRMLLAFLLNNNLQNNTLMFFADGHSLYSTVINFFSWHKRVTVILDWYHLWKKCKELLSMSLNGRKNRNSVLKKMMPLLWHGLVDQTINYLNSVPESHIKNKEEIRHLIRYLKKNRLMIPAYVVRRELGLRNSSNRGEKSNDLIVAERQKNNGMSWSKSGSVALASVTALKNNKEYQKWFQDAEIEFKLAA